MAAEMAKLVYSVITSLDGYVEDEQGDFDWAAPDEEVHAFVNDLERGIGTYLYGRRMYETMVFWETMGTGSDQPGGVARLRGDLALSTEDRLFAEPLDPLQREDANRGRVRSSRDPDLEGSFER